MIYLLPLSLAGSYLVLGWQRQRQPKPSLIEVLAPQTALPQPKHTLLARLDDVTLEQNLALSVGLLGLTTVGYLGMPLLRLLSLPGLFYLDLYFIRAAYQEWQAERQIGMAVSDAVLATGLLVTRQWGADSLFVTLFFTSRKLQAKSAERLIHALPALPDIDGGAGGDPGVATISDPPAIPPASVTTSGKPQWQAVIDQGALPLLTLSTVSIPLLGVKRALAVLLTNFGYDYRVTAPLSTVSYLAAAKERGIWLRDSQVLETLQQVDILILDVPWGEAALATLQPGNVLEVIVPAPATPALDKAAMIAQLQAEGHIVAYFSQEPVDSAVIAQADAVVCSSREHTPGVDVVLGADQPAQIQQLFDLRTAFARNRKRGFYLALAPSLINLGGIYFYHFGVITALLVDYGGATVGLLNAMAPRLLVADNTKGSTQAPVVV